MTDQTPTRINDPSGPAPALAERAVVRFRLLARKALHLYPALPGPPGVAERLRDAATHLDDELRGPAAGNDAAFVRRAAERMRAGLIDLLDPASKPHPLTPTRPSDPHETRAEEIPSRPSASADPARAAAWLALHRAVGTLPGPERDLCDALWYLGLTPTEAVAILDRDEASVRAGWVSARLRLFEALDGALPPPD